MDKPLRSFDWTRARAFLATAETGSLSAAARQLGLTQPTLGRQVAALEEELGVLLFERVGRSLSLTDAGLELLEHVRAMAIAADRVSLTASGQSQSIEGEVRVTASDVFSAYLLPAALRRIQIQAPRLEINVIAVNDIQDLMRREADIAIRHIRPEQPELIARLVRQASARLYASPAYLADRPQIRTASDLAEHEFISFGDPAEMLGHLVPLGIPITLKNFRLGSKSGLVAWEYARQGFGILAMSDEVAIAAGMVPVLPIMDPIQFPIWLTTHREIHTSRRIRLVFDLLAETLAHDIGQGR